MQKNSIEVDSYDYSDDKVTIILRGLSVERLMRYKELAPENRERQLQLYVWNTMLSESLYIPIQGLEIITRNYFHMKLCECFGNEWYDNPNIRFSYPQRNSLTQAKETLKKENKPFTASNLISLLSFGFWSGLLGSKYENTLWRNCLYRAFPNRPSSFLRKYAHREFYLIRVLRNRIAHHEPILRIDLPNHNQRIFKMITWFCQETSRWISAQSRFDNIWHSPRNIFLNKKIYKPLLSDENIFLQT